LGLLDFSEPFEKLLTQGMVLKDGEVMSKSRGNIVDPDGMIKKFGADSLRLYILFTAPPQDQTEWSQQGLAGAHRFLSRVWRLSEQVKDGVREGGKYAESAILLQRKTHQTIKKVTEDIETFKLNTAIASIMELVNEIYRLADKIPDKEPVKESIKTAILLLSPFVPHITEEMWARSGNEQSILKNKWPVYNPELIREETVAYIIQVNGKVRSKIQVLVDIDEERLRQAVFADERTKSWIAAKTVKKFIVVPNKLVNIVV
ncbi:class I tRNA ligase family protein, partial [Candidatus Omnitrophota bacterium]